MKPLKNISLDTLILFIIAVFLATLVTFKIIENQESKNQKREALKAIKTELVNNQYILDSWELRDTKIRNQLDTLIDKTRSDKNYEGRLPVVLQMAEKRSISANQSISSFDESAWLALKSSNAIFKFDYETLNKLESVYGSQRYLIEMYSKVPETRFLSGNDRKYSNDDAIFLLKLRGIFGKLQLAEQQLGYHYEHVFELPEFKSEQE